jgi:hypothetical protein
MIQASIDPKVVQRIGSLFSARIRQEAADAKNRAAVAAFNYIMDHPVALTRGGHHWTGYWHINQRVTVNGEMPILSPPTRENDIRGYYSGLIEAVRATGLAKIQWIGIDDTITIATAVPYADILGGVPGLGYRIYREAAIVGRAAMSTRRR